MRKFVELLPLQFRILYRQFLLRVIDLEALSIEADIPRFLGQFASVLVFVSLMHSFFSSAILQAPWLVEQYLIGTMMLVVGLIAVISWDATFPDRRDVMVLLSLPLPSHIILLAKVAASSALIGLAILTLNFAPGVVCPLLLGSQHASRLGFFQSFAAYWFTMAAASVFLFGSVLTVQGLTALLLPHRLFLRLSAILQIAVFGLILAGYFMTPSLTTPAAMAAPENHWVLAWSPSFWFFGLFNQLNGSLPTALEWLANRAWIGLGIVGLGAIASLLLCYLRTMKKTVEEPDLVPGARGSHWSPRFGSPLQTAIVLFCGRSIARSRQHRLALAFYLALIFSIALSWLRIELSSRALRPLTADFLVSTFMMMSFAVFGLRSVFSLPISLTANWVWRLTQLRPSEKYIAATRWSLLSFAVVPVWIISALLSLSYRPLHYVAAHLAVLALVGWIFAEIGLIGLYKVPFTCSYLPGKVHVQVLFWCFLLLLVVFAMSTTEFELPSFNNTFRYVCMVCVLGTVALGLLAFNRHRAKSAVLYFEELPPDVITTLGLV